MKKPHEIKRIEKELDNLLYQLNISLPNLIKEKELQVMKARCPWKIDEIVTNKVTDNNVRFLGFEYLLGRWFPYAQLVKQNETKIYITNYNNWSN